MATSDRWRVVGITTVAGLELTGLELYDSGGTRLDAAATLAAGHTPEAGMLSALQDGSAATWVRFAVADARQPGFRLVWQFPAPVDVAYAKPYAGADALAWMSALRIEYWDGARWQPAAAQGDMPWPGPGAAALPQLPDPYESGVRARVMPQAGAIVDAGPAHLPVTNGGVSVNGDAMVFPGGAGKFISIAGIPGLGGGAVDYCIDILANIAETTQSYSPLFSLDAGATKVYFLPSRALSVWSTSQLAQSGTGVFAFGAEFHFRLARVSSVVRGYVNGVQVLSYTDAHALSATPSLSIGGDDYWPPPVMRVRGVVINAGQREGGAFAPWGAVPGFGSLHYDVPVPVARDGAVPLPVDLRFGGRATIAGDVAVKGQGGAPDLPVRSRVRLFRQRDGLLAREAWSDPATGAFAFDGIDESQQYIALAEDGSGVYAPVAADRRVPEVPA